MAKGTEWLKTDLHIHVPKTAMNDQYKLDAVSRAQLLETRGVETKKDASFLGQKEKDEAVQEQFLKKLAESDLDIIGLTDYFSVDNFEIYSSELRKQQKRVFPNVELRLTEDAGRGHINLHLIFSDQVKVEAISAMLSRLKCNGQRLGDIPRSEYSDVTVSLDTLKEELEGAFPSREDSYFVVVPVRGDGLYDPELKTGNSGRYRSVAKNVAQFADALFGNANDLRSIRSIDWAAVSGAKGKKKKSLSPNEELGVRIGRPMAVFRGSDAHSFDRLAAFPDDGAYTWVRGLRDFSVLQQTVVEPESRLEISPRMPGLKRPEHVIRKVSFGNDQYMPDVEFNPGLNSIIGPRSSGKSTLLAHTAYAVDADKTLAAQQAAVPERSLDDFGPAEGHRWQDALSNLDVKVEWEDGTISSSSDLQGTRMVHYVPQNFLFQLSSGDRRNTDKLIEKQISQNPSAKSIYEKILNEYSQCKAGIRESAKRFRLDSIERETLRQKIREAGDENALQNEFEEAQRALKEITAGSENPEGQAALEIVELHTEIEQSAKALRNSAGSVEALLEHLDVETVWATLFENTDSDTYLQWLYTQVEPVLADAVYSVNAEVRRLLIEGNRNASKIQDNLSAYINREDVKKRAYAFTEVRGSRLADAKQRYDTAKTQCDKHKKFLDELDAVERRVNEELDSLVKKYDEWVESFANLQREFEQEISLEENESSYLNFVESGRDTRELDSFRDFFLERGQDKEFKSLLAELDGLQFTEEVVSKVASKIFAGDAKVAAKYRGRDDLFPEFCEALIPVPRFGSNFEGDTIGGFKPTTMTAGKRALFALTVLLGDDDSPWPLLLDQPEDDLDSRSIFNTIAPFLRKGSIKRQILMVTHNANLVVGADSDLTIVVNRHSKGYPNGSENPSLFLSVAGALEQSQRSVKSNSPFFLRRKSIKRHICEVVDGGRDAFEKRQKRYWGKQTVRIPSFSGHPICADFVSVGEDVHCESTAPEVHAGLPA